MEYSREQKIKIFESLPDDIKEAILSVELPDKIQTIASNNSLMLDQASELADEIGLYMIGLTKQRDFVKNISIKLNINKDLAEKVSIDVSNEIFSPIRSSLQEIQSNEEESVIAEPEPVPPPPIVPPPIPPAIPPRPQAPIPPQQPSPIPPPIPPRPQTPIPPPPVKPPPMPPPPPPPKNINLTDIERVGEFTLEKRPPSHSPQYNDHSLDRDKVLEEIENMSIQGQKRE